MAEAVKKPYLTPEGELTVPFDNPKYQWWKEGGQSLADTLVEINAPYEALVRYLGEAAAKKIMEGKADDHG